MEPPCEHGGVLLDDLQEPADVFASMEPPCEHGGVNNVTSGGWALFALQWSRRVNTAEC